MNYLTLIGLAFVIFSCSFGIAITFVLARIGLDYVRGAYGDAKQVDGLIAEQREAK